MGFWRYIYRTDFLRAKAIRFVGTLEELGADFFVLDDYFFLLNVLAQYETATTLKTYVYKYYANPNASYLRYRQQSRFMARAAEIQIVENSHRISGNRWIWYSNSLRQQLFSSYRALLLRDAFKYFFEFKSAIALINNSSGLNILSRLRDQFVLIKILVRHFAFRFRETLVNGYYVKF